MELAKIKEELEKIDDVMSDEELEKEITLNRNMLIEAMEDNPLPHGTANLIIAIEELSELQQEVSKFIRKNGDIDMVSLAEEICDVELGIGYIKQLTGVPDELIKKIKMIKITKYNNMLNQNKSVY